MGMEGIEPPSSALQAVALPLCYIPVLPDVLLRLKFHMIVSLGMAGPPTISSANQSTRCDTVCRPDRRRDPNTLLGKSANYSLKDGCF